MPWREVSKMEQRREFVALARGGVMSLSELCRRYGISRPTAYKWLERLDSEGLEGLADRSRRPHASPKRSSAELEAEVIRLHELYPAWGARKLHGRMRNLGVAPLPAVSTVHAILRRNGCIKEQEVQQGHWKRFEHEAPNELWQMDFKGHFPLSEGRCHPLTILDDHSRFSIAVDACADERGQTVRATLERVFKCYGLPKQILADNGGPWGNQCQTERSLTRLTVWLMRLGIDVVHGRPHHPQTQGKIERFHRTLKAEAIKHFFYDDLRHAQRGLDRFRAVYNHERPHDALGGDVPAARYAMSKRPFPSSLPPIEYGPDDLVRKVQYHGEIHFKNRTYLISRALHREPVALRPTGHEHILDVYYCQTKILQIDLKQHQEA